MAKEIKWREVKSAYRKLKSYIYHDNFLLPLRVELAKYEVENVKGKGNAKWQALADEFNKNEKNNILKDDIEKIEYRIYPKKYKDDPDSDLEKGHFFSNVNIKDQYIVERITPFINCSIDIHIFTILWLIKIGQKLDEQLIKNCFGNRLVRYEEDYFKEYKIKLFHIYYKKYNEWRDKAITKAKELHKLGIETAILNLDIKNYYHSVNFDVSKKINLGELGIDEDFKWMNTVLENIHSKYREKINHSNLIEGENGANPKNYLPIGLLSSHVIANYYLNDFDRIISSKIKPIFYGRYVDDILIVFGNPQSIDNNASVSEFIQHNLCGERFWNKGQCELAPGDKNSENEIDDFKIHINDQDELKFQLSKVKLYHFSPNESINLLDEFEKEIQKNSSEFRFQPETNEIFTDFESSSFKISYSDTVNKIRSIEEFKSDKLGASTHLTKLIKLNLLINTYPKNLLEATNTILGSYFQGKRGLENYHLWEKLFVFYLITQEKNKLIESSHKLQRATFLLKYEPIDENKCEETKINEITKKLKKDLIEFLGHSFAMAFTLNLGFLTEYLVGELRIKDYKGMYSDVLKKIDTEKINDNSRNLITANLLRHNYINYPLLAYCEQSHSFSFCEKKLLPSTNYKLDDEKKEYSPRFVHYHEIVIFNKLKEWNSTKNSEEKETNSKPDHSLTLGKILEQYLNINKLQGFETIYGKTYPLDDNGKYEKSKGKDGEKEKKEIKYLQVDRRKFSKINPLKFGIINHQVNFQDSLNSIKGKTNLAWERLMIVNQILNQSLRTHCDILIFPEISIPFQWISQLSYFSVKNNIAIICGLEHFSIKKNVYNYITTILPFTSTHYSNCYPDFRLKKDYSPNEIRQIQNIGYNVPYEEMKNEQLRIFNWHNIFFSTLNCFELSDIKKRADFKGLLDFIVTIEWNKDIPYFSNISESLARDIHSYVVQVNTSQYGDSRITQPAKTEVKDILKIKGGEDSLLITGTIDIDKLREFQSHTYNGQDDYEKKNQVYKKTPADFIPAKARKF